MLIPIIKVKDGNFEHIVGTNSHDVLYVDEESGGIQYLNIQCYEGTKKFNGEQTMRFVGEAGHFEEAQVQFVTIEELIELAIRNMKDGTERKLRLHQMMGDYLKEKGECQEKLESDDIRDTSGALLFRRLRGMSNKATGTRFEKEFASILAERWFWVHIFQDNKNGQPCDVIAARDGRAYLFDCKNCETGFFFLSRMEENQYNAMVLYSVMGNPMGMFAIRFPSGETYLLTYKQIKEMQDAGFKRINETVCRTQGMTLEEWLKRGEADAGDGRE